MDATAETNQVSFDERAKCKKCKQEIPKGSIYCLWCGYRQKKAAPKKMYQRPDGLFEKMITVDGKRLVFRGKTMAEVNRKMLDYKEKEGHGPTFLEIADAWEATHFDELAPNTKKGYLGALNRLHKEFDDEYIKDITPQRIQHYLDRMAKQGFAKKTLLNHRSVLTLLLKDAFINGFIQSIPSEHIRINKTAPKRKVSAPNDAQIMLVKNNADTSLMGLLAYFILYSGLRRGEAFALRWADIDFTRMVISVTKSAYTQNRKAYIKSPKTEAGCREVILLNRLAQQLKPGKPTDLVFPDPQNGGVITDGRFEVLWRHYQQDTGINITPHQLRHGFATMLFEAGIQKKDAQELLGHTNIALTMDVYTDIRKSHKEETAAKLNAYDF